MYKIVISLVAASVLAACSDAPPKEEVVLSAPAPAANEAPAQTATSQPAPAAQAPQDPYLVIDIDTTSKYPEVQTLIDETVKEYQGIVAEIRSTFAENKANVTAEIDSNIAEIKAGYEEQNAEYLKECSEITSNNEASCNRFGEQTHNLKMKYEALEIKKNNIIAKISSDEENELRKYLANVKNNIMALKQQSGEL